MLLTASLRASLRGRLALRRRHDWNRWARASEMAGEYSAGFQTTVLPQVRAGMRYHDGTATGKFPAVIMAATPTGTRKVKSCLSGISEGTVWP